MSEKAIFHAGYQRIVGACTFLAGGLSLSLMVIGGFGHGYRPVLANGYLFQSPLAGSLILALSATLVLARRGPGRRQSRFGLALAGLVAGVTLAVLVAYALGTGPAWAVPAGDGRLARIRLSVLSSVALLATSLAYLTGVAFPGARWWRRQISAVLALVPMAIGAAVLVSYLAGATLDLLNASRSTPMSLASAVCVILLGLATLLVAGTDTWPLAMFGSEATHTESRGSRWLSRGPLALFVALAAAIVMIGGLYLQREVKAARQTARHEVAAIADSKSMEVRNWVQERRGDADQIRRSSLLQDGMGRYLAGAIQEAPGLQAWMTSLIQTCGYSAVALYDGSGRARLVASQAARPDLPGPASPSLASVLRGREPLLEDLHREPGAAGVWMGFWVPVGGGGWPAGGGPGGAAFAGERAAVPVSIDSGPVLHLRQR